MKKEHWMDWAKDKYGVSSLLPAVHSTFLFTSMFVYLFVCFVCLLNFIDLLPFTCRCSCWRDHDHFLHSTYLHHCFAFQTKTVEDVKALLKVLFMFLPMPVFWTLFDQQVRVVALKKSNNNNNNNNNSRTHNHKDSN